MGKGKKKGKKFVPYDERMKLTLPPGHNVITKINNSLNTSSEISESSKSNIANDSFNSSTSQVESSKSENYEHYCDDIQGQSCVENNENNIGSSTQELDSKNGNSHGKAEITDACVSKSDVAELENDLKEVSLELDDKRSKSGHNRNYSHENKIYQTQSRGYGKSNRRENNSNASSSQIRIPRDHGREKDSHQYKDCHTKSELSTGINIEDTAGLYNKNKDTETTLNANAESFVPGTGTDNINKQTTDPDTEIWQENYNVEKLKEKQNKSVFTNLRDTGADGVKNKREYNRHSDMSWRNNNSSTENKAFFEKSEKYNSNRHSSGNSDVKENKSNFKSRFSDSRIIREKNYDLDRNFEKTDSEYKKFLNEEKKNGEVEFTRISEIEHDLFTMAKDYSLGHCVAEDLKMGSGIAVNFRREFKELGDLYSQKQKQGGLAVLEHEHEEGKRYIYYLITKRESIGKPTYETFWSSVKKMRDHISSHNVKKLAIPRLGCGLDRLEWSRVKHMIEFLFKDVEVEIIVCNFNQTEESPQKVVNYRNKVVHNQKPVAKIEPETTIIYLSTEDGHVSEEMEQLSTKFSSFMREFKQAHKKLGDLIKYEDKVNYYILYGCIVKKTSTDDFDFKMFQKCIQQINKNNKKDEYSYIAIQAIKDVNDELINEKIISVLRNYLINVEIYVCWDGDLVYQMPLPRND